jgi:glutamate carboxypeptidase
MSLIDWLPLLGWVRRSLESVIFLIIFFIPICCHAALSGIEQNILATVNQQHQDAILLLKTLVNINSGTANVAGVSHVGHIVEQQLRRLGFETHWTKEPSYMHHADTLVAFHHGSLGKKLLLIGHLDTVFENDSDFKKFKLEKNIALGPGVLDDKGGIVVLLYALQALYSNHVLDGADITVVLTGDEEQSGKPVAISRQSLFEAAREVDIALDFEPATSQDTLSIARRGVASWIIEARGHEAHAAGIFSDSAGSGAIFELSRILNAMSMSFSREPHLAFNPGLIVGGNTISYNQAASSGHAFGRDNVVSKVAFSRGDFRFLDDAQKQSFEKRLEEIVALHLPGTTSTVHFEDAIPAMPPTANNSALLAEYSAVSVDLNQGPVKTLDADARGAGDISHIASRVPANLVGLGPFGSGEHTKQETLRLASLPTQTARAAIFLYRLIHVTSDKVVPSV